jgi:predicted thioesterase
MEIGKKYTSTLVVEEKHLACQVGSGDLRVLATPMMMALMENAAMRCVADELDDGSTTVGGQISSSHLKPTGLGHTVTATAELIAVEGRKLKFRISASDEEGLIGEGEHLRFVVGRERFMQKVTEL